MYVEHSGVKLSAAIMAHPKRSQFVDELTHKLDADVPVVWDQISNRWDTGRRSMLTYDPKADFHLILQDDAVICQDLLYGTARMLSVIPEKSAVSLYSGVNRPRFTRVPLFVDVATDKTVWFQMNELYWGVAIILPTECIDRLVEWGDRNRQIQNYDLRISRWLSAYGYQVWYTWPSLVDHRVSPSMVKGRGHNGRVAYKFIGEDESPLDLDPHGEVVTRDVALSRGRKESNKRLLAEQKRPRRYTQWQRKT